MTQTGDATELVPLRTAIAWRPVWLVAAAIGVIHLAVAARYGWHHDEFYYVITGRHPAWGYVDQPPLVPFLARLAAALPGDVLPLRLLAIAAQIGCVLLGAALAAEFGGGRRAQVIAAAAVGACLAFVGAALLFGTTVTDQVVWLALFVLVARALRSGTTGAWLWAGLVAGIGLENKDTVAVLLAGIAAGLLVYRRDVLRTPGPWLAGAVAVVLALPNVLWDALHGWPNLAMAHALAAKQGGPLGALAQVPLLALIGAGPTLIALWVLGVRWLGSPDGHAHRWLLAATVV
ncbi:MAG TPA: glycosyltransferase family 39 protein, partial [Pseudonocardiaceae bacterium]